MAGAAGGSALPQSTTPTILTPDALGALKERLETPPDDGGVWTRQKIARWLAAYHGLKSVHDQRAWDAGFLTLRPPDVGM